MEEWPARRRKSTTWSGARLYSFRRSSSSVPAPFASEEIFFSFAAASSAAASSQVFGWTLSKFFIALTSRFGTFPSAASILAGVIGSAAARMPVACATALATAAAVGMVAGSPMPRACALFLPG